MSRPKVLSVLQILLRYLTVAVASSLFGAGLLMTVLAQERPLPMDRPPLVQTAIALNSMRIDDSEKALAKLDATIREDELRIQELTTDVATVRGVGMGLGAVLALLQVLQALVGRMKRNDS